VLHWLRKLNAHKRRAITAALEHVLAEHGPQVCATAWGKWVAAGIFEFRLRYDHRTVLQSVGLPVPETILDERRSDVLLRVFCHAADGAIVLLGAYDKGSDPSRRRQQRELRLARTRLNELRARRAKESKQNRR
jgi:phage-related protein